jgi:outer membrane receptor protein involved in Fe transport
VNAGIRFDHYRLIADENAWSPRLGFAYELPKVGFVVRGSYDRVFQIPAMENILLASSDEVRNLGGEGTFLSLRPSRGNFVELGFSKSVSRHVRLDGNWYRRTFENFADDSLLFNTGVSFPIAFSEANVHGLESKIDFLNFGPFTGQISYANMVGLGRLPVAGGLFLGDEADGCSTRMNPSQYPKTNATHCELSFVFSRIHDFWFAFATSYNSGLPSKSKGSRTRLLSRSNMALRFLIT